MKNYHNNCHLPVLFVVLGQPVDHLHVYHFALALIVTACACQTMVTCSTGDRKIIENTRTIITPPRRNTCARHRVADEESVWNGDGKEQTALDKINEFYLLKKIIINNLRT